MRRREKERGPGLLSDPCCFTASFIGDSIDSGARDCCARRVIAIQHTRLSMRLAI